MGYIKPNRAASIDFCPLAFSIKKQKQISNKVENYNSMGKHYILKTM